MPRSAARLIVWRPGTREASKVEEEETTAKEAEREPWASERAWPTVPREMGGRGEGGGGRKGESGREGGGVRAPECKGADGGYQGGQGGVKGLGEGEKEGRGNKRCALGGCQGNKMRGQAGEDEGRRLSRGIGKRGWGEQAEVREVMGMGSTEARQGGREEGREGGRKERPDGRENRMGEVGPKEFHRVKGRERGKCGVRIEGPPGVAQEHGALDNKGWVARGEEGGHMLRGDGGHVRWSKHKGRMY